MTLHEIQKKLRKANSKHYRLYLFCNFMGLMLITAFSMILFSPTVMDVLPPGGDSRKQMYAVFALTCVGCLVFTIYAAGLFFRMKSKETGIFLALGASRSRLMPTVVQETAALSGISALFGILCGVPFAAGLWNLLRILVVNTPEMELHLNFRALFISFLFLILVMFFAAFTGMGYLKRTNIMSVIHEEHQNEPVKEPKKWYGIVGIILLFSGAILGYYSEQIYRALFHAYGPVWLSITYLPVFLGLYMILLHTVMNGWRHSKNIYKGIISRSMMKFQGKQTVNSLLVITVLIAGGCFGLFYIPFSVTSALTDLDARTYDYAYRVPAYVSAPDKAEVTRLANEENVRLEDWLSVPYAVLAIDGMAQLDDADNKFHYEYWKLLDSTNFLSASNYKLITGQDADVTSGTYKIVWNTSESSYTAADDNVTLITNMVTRETLSIKYGGILHYNQLTGYEGFCVLADSDYETITSGLLPEWLGFWNGFHIKGEDSYAFSKKLYHAYVDAMELANIPTLVLDPVYEAGAKEAGLTVDYDLSWIGFLTYDQPDTTNFRIYWDYYPQFRLMERMDILKNMAVFFMVFLFIVIVCFMAALIICYTRCMTIALNNRYLFEDLEKLGASRKFIKKEIQQQSSKLFAVPSIVGMGSMFLLYFLIMFANDNKLTNGEILGMLICGGLQIFIGLLLYIMYRKASDKMYQIVIK